MGFKYACTTPMYSIWSYIIEKRIQNYNKVQTYHIKFNGDLNVVPFKGLQLRFLYFLFETERIKVPCSNHTFSFPVS